VWCDVDDVEFSYYGAPAPTPKEQLYDELVDGLRGSDPIVGSGSQVMFHCFCLHLVFTASSLDHFFYSSNDLLCYNWTMTTPTSGLQCFPMHQVYL